MSSISERFINFFGVPPCDRTGTLDSKLEEKHTVSIPQYTHNFNKELKDIANDRANELHNYDMEKCLLWSGGIDSTVAFYSLIQANIKFEVILTEDSIKEYPMLSKQILNNEFSQVTSYKNWNDISSDYFSNKTIITGEIGDQCIGSQKLYDYSYEDRMKPYKEVIDQQYYDPFNQSVITLLGHDNLTLGEFLWALNFIFKYENVIERINNKVTQSINYEFFHFFNSDEFQLWAIANYKKNVDFKKHTDYKAKYKEYIYSINNDEIYFKYKKKIPSLKQLKAEEFRNVQDS